MIRLLFRSPFAGTFIGLICLFGIYQFSDIFRKESNFYEEADPNFKTEIVLVEKSQEMNLKLFHEGLFPPSRDLPIQSYINLISGVAPALAVIDINNDSYFDVYAIGIGLGSKNKLFINHKGEFFTEEADKWGIADVNQDYFSEIPIFSDLNGDGNPDLLLGRSGCHSVYLNQAPKAQFKELKNAFDGYCSNTRGLSVFDFDQDGIRDIFMGNYFAPVDLNNEYPPRFNGFTIGDDVYGGVSNLLRGQGDGHFVVSKKFESKYKNHTFTSGVGDFNKDGWPDIFEGNDLTYDRLYYNRKGTFEEVTASDLPMERHGFAGMNSEVFDYDHDGWLDLYVTNIYGPPYSRGGNILWRGGPSGFTDVSDDLGVRRCGWSWGAKFVDLDLDGKEEIIVGGGMVRGEKVSSYDEGELFWYRRGQIVSTPSYLRPYTKNIINADKMNFFGYQRGCLFQSNSKTEKYADVAPQAGFGRFDNSRALALIDLDNDGRVDVLTGNYNDWVRLYHNETPPKKNWLGLDLKLLPRSNDPAIGSRVRVFKGNKLVYFREIYPFNGHRGQSDPRIVLAADDADSYKVEVKWSDGQIEIFNRFEINKYNAVVKKLGIKKDEEITPEL